MLAAVMQIIGAESVDQYVVAAFETRVKKS
jgi:hypothetical protein